MKPGTKQGVQLARVLWQVNMSELEDFRSRQKCVDSLLDYLDHRKEASEEFEQHLVEQISDLPGPIAALVGAELVGVHESMLDELGRLAQMEKKVIGALL